MAKHKINPLLRLTLAGLPELDYFPTPEARDTALYELGRDAGMSAPKSLAAGIAIIAAFTLSLVFAVKWLLRLVHWPRLLEEWILISLAGGFVFLLLRFLHRRGFVSELRAKLVANGVPICIPCGYLLRGLPETTTNCPECGKIIEPKARAVISSNQKDARATDATKSI